MFDVHVVSDKVQKRLDDMAEKIHAMGWEEMPQELTVWQTEDMHRQYPETKVEQLRTKDEVSAITMIYPRSRTYADTHPHHQHRPGRSRRLSSLPRLVRSSTMRHPILRSVLFDKLFARMSHLLKDKVTWQ
jgi:hypothetical protein